MILFITKIEVHKSFSVSLMSSLAFDLNEKMEKKIHLMLAKNLRKTCVRFDS